MIDLWPAAITLWAVTAALLTVPAFWRGEQPDPETWDNNLTNQGA